MYCNTIYVQYATTRRADQVLVRAGRRRYRAHHPRTWLELKAIRLLATVPQYADFQHEERARDLVPIDDDEASARTTGSDGQGLQWY